MNILLGLLAVSLLIVVAVLAIIYVIAPIFQGIGFLIRHVFRFIGGELGDALRVVGGIITTVVFIPLVLLNIVIGRWSASRHFGSAIQGEIGAIGGAMYRILIGHPARLLGMRTLVEGIEDRVPAAMAGAPTRDTPRKRTGQFEEYKIVGSLKGGGSGAKLYVANPSAKKRAIFARQGRADVEQVVIKSFSLSDGSSLPQIVRESRALEAAKDIGLVLEHELTEQRFYYVMPYVPGEPLGQVTQRLHASAGPEGLSKRGLVEAMGYGADLLRTLESYHRGGLWHKDVKPDNIIVHEGHAHLVDLGLVTPLRSAMTLTTHGTEYFRDPEMVRMALRGVKVHEVEGAKFDVFAAGAVLYSVIENSFPAHGGLSQVTKRCPEALRWIIRRSMADYERRYSSAQEMLTDIEALLTAEDAFKVKPAELPSMSGGGAAMAAEEAPEPQEDFGPPVGAGAARNPIPPKATPATWRPEDEPGRGGAATAARKRPDLRVTGWWTGKYAVDDDGHSGARPHRAAPPPHWHAGPRPSAADQLASARKRVESARARARARMNRGKQTQYSNSPNLGVGIAVASLVLVGVLVFSGIKLNNEQRRSAKRAQVEVYNGESNERAIIRGEDGETIEIDTEAIAKLVREQLESFGVAEEMIRKAVDTAIENAHVRAEDAEVKLAALRESLNGQSWQGDPPAAPPAPATPVETSWLVVDELIDDAPEDVRASILRTLTGLKRRGVELVGLGSAESDIEARASVLATVGSGRPTDPETRKRLAGWLQTHSDAADAVLWIEWQDDEAAPRYHLFTGADLDKDRGERLLRAAR